MLLEGQEEDHAPVAQLQDEGMVALIKPGHNDMAALDELDAILFPRPGGQGVYHFGDPGARGIDQSAGEDLPSAAGILQRRMP